MFPAYILFYLYGLNFCIIKAFMYYDNNDY